jgi:hypothetical protein
MLKSLGNHHRGSGAHYIATIILASTVYFHLAHAEVKSDFITHIVTSTTNTVTFTIQSNGLSQKYQASVSNKTAELNFGEYGQTYEYNRPILPMYSRFIIVPPQASIELQISSLVVSKYPAVLQY